MRARALLLTLALVGCWKGGAGNAVTSLDGALVVGDLDDAKFAQLCADIDHWNQAEFGSDKYRAIACEIEGATKLRQQFPSPAAQHQACRDLAHQCEVAHAGKPNITAQCRRDPVRCPLKVADVETCLYDLSYDMNIALCTAPVCDDICGIVDPRSVDPPSCIKVYSACPGFLFSRPSYQWLVELPLCTSDPPVTTSCVWR